MASYNIISPYARREQALAAKAEREERRLYNSQLAERREAQRQQQEQQARQEAEERERAERENQGFLLRSVSTLGDIVGNVLTGAFKGLEGVVDLGAGLVGAVGGIFDGGFQEDVKDFVAQDWVGQYIGQPLQELTKYSYTNDGKVGEIIEDVAESVGQMLPAVAVSAATAGLGAAPVAAQMASLGTLGVSAAGTGTESAFQDGADLLCRLRLRRRFRRCGNGYRKTLWRDKSH